MRRESLVKSLLCAAAVSALCVTATEAQAKVVTLRHDVLADNADAVAVCGFAIGEKLGASFTPPAYPAKLLKVRILLTDVGLSLTPPCPGAAVADDVEMPLEVFNLTDAAPGSSFGEFDGFLFSNDSVLNEIDVAASNMTISEGAFFLAYSIVQSNASPVHDNSKAAHNDENFIFADVGSGASWLSFTQLAGAGLAPKGDWVIRVDVDVPDDLPDAGAGDAGGAAGAAGGGGSAGAAGNATGGTGGSNVDCSKDTDCDGGLVCDTDLGRCVQAPSGGSSDGGDDDGGCAVGATPVGSYGFGAGVLALLLAWHARRRRS